MARRLMWLATGVAVGAGSSLWAERKVRKAVDQAAARLQPAAVAVEAGRATRRVASATGDRVRDAVRSGREEMRQAEEHLWAELSARVGGPTPAGTLRSADRVSSQAR